VYVLYVGVQAEAAARPGLPSGLCLVRQSAVYTFVVSAWPSVLLVRLFLYSRTPELPLRHLHLSHFVARLAGWLAAGGWRLAAARKSNDFGDGA
jgi:hypothetical protein